jgi:multidrug efflux system outer membrane protein
LLGRSNSSDLEIKTAAAPTLPPLPATGLPADLLLNRPDLLAEYERLSAKEYGVAIARADRLPALTLTGSLTDSESRLADLLDNWAGNLAAGLVAPLIDGGRRKAEVDYQLARIEEGVALYRQKVITAISEVDNALLQERKTAEQLTLQRRQLAVLNQQLNEAQIRYRNSLVDYLNVISALTSKQNMERTLINTELSLYSARIELYRALGGGAQ